MGKIGEEIKKNCGGFQAKIIYPNLAENSKGKGIINKMTNLTFYFILYKYVIKDKYIFIRKIKFSYSSTSLLHFSIHIPNNLKSTNFYQFSLISYFFPHHFFLPNLSWSKENINSLFEIEKTINLFSHSTKIFPHNYSTIYISLTN